MTNSEEQSPRLSPLKMAFLRLLQAEARIKELETLRGAPIAIVGIGCRFPGAEDGPDALWSLIRDQRCGVSEGLEKRLSAWVGSVSLPESARRAALLRNVDMFDPQHFKISPREAATMDPQQRLLLEVSWEALEYAGIDPRSLYQTRTGVYIGIASHDYAQLQIRGGDLSKLHSHSASGTALSIAAGRIAYTLGLNGPAICVDTACSSSLVAVHLACEALRGQECSMALAGGVNLILTPTASVAFAAAGMLSSHGMCSPFLRSADGFVRGEGCGIVALKRLADAEAAGDRVLAVIIGSAVNQDGASSNLTAPNGLAQVALLREAYRRSGVDLSNVGYVETHATGSKLGDPIEAEALGVAFAERSKNLVIGSVKSNIGHLESAAGIAGLIKVVMSLEHGEIPGEMQATSLSEHIRWSNLRLELPSEARPWEPIDGRRIGGVSAYGFSGTNAHVVVEGHSRKIVSHEESEKLDVLCLSARTEAALREMAARYAAFLPNTTWGWSEICYTAGIGRAQMAERLAVVATSRNAAAEKLASWLCGSATRGIYQNRARGSSEAPGRSAGSDPDAVAKQFVSGGAVNWEPRAAGGELRRAQLPTYPFQRQRYWFEERGSSPVIADRQLSGARAEIAPRPDDLRLLIASVPAEQRLGIIRNFLQAQVTKVLGMDPDTPLDEETPLTELGMDSLMALELKNSLQQSSGMKLPVTFLFAFPTIGGAALYLNAIIGSARSESGFPESCAEVEDISL